MDEAHKSYERGQVLEIINSVISKMEGASDPTRQIYQQLADLLQTIERLKNDISETRPDHVKSEAIPVATDELDAVVEATAEATNAIMAACEELEKISETVEGENSAAIIDQVTKIYEACGFQDITGQRINKVVATLHTIETTVEGLIKTLDDQVGPLLRQAKANDDREGDEALLNGPQMPDKAVTQEDIDKLLAEFDG